MMVMATMSDAHREWHLNAGVPMGQPGCPQDACHLPDFDSEEEAEAYFASLKPRPAPSWKEAAPVSTQHVKCGNRRKHGADVVYHDSAAAVRACYSGNFVPQSAPAPAPAPAPVAAPVPEPESTQPAFERVSVEEMQTWRSIPVGRGDTAYYALEDEDGTVAFYRVRRPSTGKYRGRTYVDQQAGDYFNRMPFRASAVVMSRIAADPLAASRLYGQRIEKCGMCHRTLTDDKHKGPDGLTSLERGIGPECAKKLGMV